MGATARFDRDQLLLAVEAAMMSVVSLIVCDMPGGDVGYDQRVREVKDPCCLFVEERSMLDTVIEYLNRLCDHLNVSPSCIRAGQVCAAIAAIERVMSDTSVPQSTTRSSLRELQEHVVLLLSALQEECEADEA